LDCDVRCREAGNPFYCIGEPSLSRKNAGCEKANHWHNRKTPRYDLFNSHFFLFSLGVWEPFGDSPMQISQKILDRIANNIELSEG
jgi:hypothetical protein